MSFSDRNVWDMHILRQEESRLRCLVAGWGFKLGTITISIFYGCLFYSLVVLGLFVCTGHCLVSNLIVFVSLSSPL